jgi:hypothetical protein
VVGELGGSGGDAGQVAEPEAGELEREVDALRARPPAGALGALGVLRLALALLGLGERVELVGEGGLDLGLRRRGAGAGGRQERPPRAIAARAPVQRGAREALGVGAQRGPSASASARARSASPSPRRAQACAVAGPMPRDSSRAAIASGLSGSKRTG